MKFLLPVGGVVDDRFGILTTYKHKGTPAGIIAGMPWAGDNCAFTDGFQSELFFEWVETMLPYRDNCLFITCPDVVGDAVATLELFEKWYQHFTGWPLAFVGQDGQEALEFPDPQNWDALFVGGSTQWKCGQGAIDVIKRAQEIKKYTSGG